MKVCLSCLLAGRRNVAWSTTIIGVTSSAAASIKKLDFFFFIIPTTSLVHSSRCTQPKVNFREKEKQVLDNILGPGRYDARIRPSGENGTGEYNNLAEKCECRVEKKKEIKRKGKQRYITGQRKDIHRTFWREKLKLRQVRRIECAIQTRSIVVVNATQTTSARIH
ncbi:Glutamate-gated chloride channel [Atta colombica]|uniref:Glutamate-gated chloride channel n=1 Tax=Atta colombica TaxID=520822 RepID=A0A195B053_9HYME|nr:Glutamate-gated chloride channel [Atta colombica]